MLPDKRIKSAYTFVKQKKIYGSSSLYGRMARNKGAVLIKSNNFNIPQSDEGKYSTDQNNIRPNA